MIQGLKLIAIDLDGTLLRDDKTYDVERFNQVISELQNKGVVFTVISGHDRQEVMTFRENIVASGLYFVSNNGNYMALDEALLYQHLIPYNDLDTIIKTLEVFEHYEVQVDDGDAIHFFTKETIDELHTLKVDMLKLSVQTGYQRPELKTMLPALQDNLPQLDVILRQSGMLEINATGKGKGETLKIIQKRHGIAPEKSLALGNQANDIDMIPYVKYFAAVANAPQSIKDLAPFVIGTNEEQGVITLLEEINLSESINTIYLYNKKGSTNYAKD